MNKKRQNDLLKILEHALHEVSEGKEVSTEYAKILFPPERREYELTYYSKIPKQSVISETFAAPIQLDRTFGTDKNGWINKIIFGDNLQILKTLVMNKQEGLLKNEDGTDGIKLIYIDPPFATKQDFSTRDEKAYADKLKGAEFLEWIRKRLILIRELLSDDGSVFVHLDWHKSHYIKILLDEIFGEGNFVNEIVWSYKDVGGGRNNPFYKRKHDVIFWYSKTKNYKVNKIARAPLSESTLNRFSTLFDSEGKITYKKFKEQRPNEFATRKKQGRVPDDLNEIFLSKDHGRQLEDVWFDINPLRKRATGNKTQETQVYPTQKPEQLLERIIDTVTTEGDIVLDCFGGSGTTAAVSEKMNRKWITCDVGKLSVYTIQKRILEIENYRTFAVYNAGHYDETKLNNFEKEDWKRFALSLYDAEMYPERVKGFQFDGIKNGSFVKVYSPYEFSDGAKITEKTLEDVYYRLGHSLGREVFIIAPQGKFGLAVDEYDNYGNWDTLFTLLRVPYSMFQKFTENFTPIKQADDADSVNDAIDSVGFDFMRSPKVDFSLKKNRLIINSFESFSRLKGKYSTNGFEAFSMVLIDYEYNNYAFNVEDVYYGHDFDKNKSVELPKISGKGNIMLIFVDKFGNEFSTIYALGNK